MPPENKSGIKDCNEWLIERPDEFVECGEKIQPLEKLLTEMGETHLLYKALVHQNRVTELHDLVKDNWLSTLLHYVRCS